MSKLEQLAWEIYCEETAGSMDVRNFWEELPERVQRMFIEKALAQATKKHGIK